MIRPSTVVLLHRLTRQRPPGFPLVLLALLLALGALGFGTPSSLAAVRYSFEDGTLQGWSATGSVAAPANSTDIARAGTHSLKVILASTSYSSAGFVRVNPGSAVGRGDVLEAYVYSSSASLVSASLYIQDKSYLQTAGNAVVLSRGWNRITCTVPAGAPVPLRLVGLQFGAASATSATIFVDEVGTVGAAQPTSTPTQVATATSLPTSTPVLPAATATPTRTSALPTGTSVATNTPAPVSGSIYDFEVDAQGWSSTGSASAVAQDPSRAYSGTGSLKVTLSATSDSAMGYARVAPSYPISAGQTITAHVYAPTAGLKVAVYVQDQGYKQTLGGTVPLAAGQWATITYSVPATAALPLRLIGVQLSGGYTGSTWIDAVSTGSPSQPMTTPTSTTPPAPPPVGSILRGVNLAAAEFGDTRIHGAIGGDYIYPTTAELDYFRSKGLKLIRLPILWERVQHSPNASIDLSGDIVQIDALLQAANARGMSVIIDVHNYGRYKQSVNGTLQTYLIGSSQLPISAYANLWSQLAQHWAGNPAVYAYDIMNEPHDMNGVWPTAAQAAVDAIRSKDSHTRILVEGDGWAGAWTWAANNPSLDIKDPSNNTVYEAHQYFDRNGSGTYASSYDAEGAYPSIGADRVQPFIDWLRANGHKGFIGEYGVPDDDPRWLTVLDNFLTRLDQSSDVELSGTYWAAGPWWGTYPLSVEPSNGTDRPQMSILTRHLGG